MQFGISAFSLPPPPFTPQQSALVASARLKMQCEDFVVVEIDTRGIRVDAPHYHPPVTPLLQATALAAEAGDAKKAPAAPQFYNEATHPLESIFAADVIAQLRQLNDGNGADDDAAAVAECCCGEFSDKNRRTTARLAIAFHFPFLQTFLREEAGSSGPAVLLLAKRDAASMRGLRDAVGDEAVRALARAAVSDPENPALSTVRVAFLPSATKDARRQFHAEVARRMPALTIRVADGAITATRHRKRGREGTSTAAATGDGASTRCFTHFVVSKRDVDAMALRAAVGAAFGCAPDSVCAAGMKDRRAVTFQLLSVPGDRREQIRTLPLLLAAKRRDDDIGFAVVLSATPSLSASPLGLGELSGNAFRIRVRFAADSSVVTAATVRELRLVVHQRLLQLESSDGGFLNFFGPQRFGSALGGDSDCCGGEMAGIHMIAERWSEAILAIFGNSHDRLRAGLALFRVFDGVGVGSSSIALSRDEEVAAQALRDAVRSGYWRESPTDTLTAADAGNLDSPLWRRVCERAVAALPFALRQLRVHAAQSAIFNRALSALASATPISGLPPSLPLFGRDHDRVGDSDAAAERAFDDALREFRLEQSHVASGSVAGGVPLRGSSRPTLVRPTFCAVAVDDDDSSDGGPSLLLAFRLPSSSYATVLLRELFGTFLESA